MSNLATITNNILADSGIDDINVIVSTGSYANPSWITSLAWTKITGAPLGDYLPLSGGTMTGAITTPNGTFGIIVGDDSRLADRNVANTLFLEGVQNNDRGYINFSQTSGNALGAVNGGNLTWRGDTVWTSGNINPVTSVTASSPLSSSGGTTPNITIVDASTTERGVVNTGSQSFAGNKTFTGDIFTGSTNNTRLELNSNGIINSFFSNEANPRFSLNRDLIGGGQAGIGFLWPSSSLAVGGSAIGIPALRTLAFYISNGTALVERVRIDSTGASTFSSSVTAGSFIRSGGTSSQYLMADGSVSTLTNPVTGTGTTNYLPKFTGTSTIGNSSITDNSTLVEISNISFPELRLKRTNSVTNAGLISFVGSDDSLKWNLGTNFNIGGAGFEINYGYTNHLFLSQSGNLGLGVTPSAWNAAAKAFEINLGSLYAFSANIALTVNGFFDSAWKYKQNGHSTLYNQSSGQHEWYTAPNNTSGAGAAISFTQSMTLTSASKLLVNTLTDNGNYFIQANGNIASINSTAAGLFTVSGTRSFAIQSFGGDWNYLRSNGAPLVFGTQDANDIYIRTNDTNRVTIAASTGAATFSSSVASTRFRTLGFVEPTSVVGLFNNTNYGGPAWNNASLVTGNGATGVMMGGDAATYTYGWISGVQTDNGAIKNLALQPLGGNVGIGTTSITASRLRVEGATSEANSIADFISNDTTASAVYHRGIRVLAPSLPVGDKILMSVGVADNTRNMGQLYFNYVGNGSASNYLSLGLFAVDEVLNITGAGNVLIGTTTDNGARLQVSGTSRFSENIYVTGGTGTNVGNGIHLFYASDFAQVQLNGVTGSFIDFSTSGTDFIGRIIYLNGDNLMRFHTNANANPAMVINSSNNVGIGTPSPVARLHAENPSNGDPTSLSSVPTTNVFGFSTSPGAMLAAGIGTAGGGPHVWFQGRNLGGAGVSYPIAFQPLGGNVLIGTTTDNGARLDVSYFGSAHNTVRLVGGGGTTAGNMLLSKISDFSDASPINLFWADHGSTARTNTLVRIHSNETLAGGYPLRVTAQGSLSSPTYEALVVNHIGNVGIGATSPTNKLHIDSADDNAYALRVQGNTNNAANVWTGIGIAGEVANTKAAILFQDIGESFSRGRLLFCINNNADQSIATPDNAVMTLNNNGNVLIGTTTDGGVNRVLSVERNQNGVSSVAMINPSTGSAASAQFIISANNSSGFYGAFSSTHSTTNWAGRSVFGTNALGGGITISAHNSGQDIRFLTESTSNIRMVVASNGNVLINTTDNPGATLHVNGTIRTGQLPGAIQNAVNWRLGTARGGPVTSNATVRVEIDGALVDLLARYV